MSDKPRNKYLRVVRDVSDPTCGAAVDVYEVLRAFDVRCPATQHAVKKLLMPGSRGAKSRVQDLREAGQSVARAVDMAERDEDAAPRPADPGPQGEQEDAA